MLLFLHQLPGKECQLAARRVTGAAGFDEERFHTGRRQKLVDKASVFTCKDERSNQEGKEMSDTKPPLTRWEEEVSLKTR